MQSGRPTVGRQSLLLRGSCLLLLAILGRVCGAATAETTASAPLPAAKASDAGFDPPLGLAGTVRKHEAFASAFVDPRDVDVWLPESYETNTDRRYAVLYAHDGQNLFDPQTSFAGIDWALDETMTRLIAEKKVREAIIVGIWNTHRRTEEYVPQKAVLAALTSPREAAMRATAKDIGMDLEHDNWQRSDAYLKFLVQELKPFVDRTYRTRSHRDDTFTLGSSSGAMISLYAVSEYPEVFGGAACLSTHWPLADGILVDYFKEHLPEPATHRIYFDFGTETIDRGYEPYQVQMDAAMRLHGYHADVNWMTCKFEGHEHSERAWRKRVHVPLEFLLGPSNDSR